jgi:hypothetical protein
MVKCTQDIELYSEHILCKIPLTFSIWYIMLRGRVNFKDTSNSKTSSKINSRSKPKNPLQTTVQGNEHSYHSFTIHHGSDKLPEKTPPVCKA